MQGYKPVTNPLRWIGVVYLIGIARLRRWSFVTSVNLQKQATLPGFILARIKIPGSSNLFSPGQADLSGHFCGMHRGGFPDFAGNRKFS
jgi:hypothetical protein